MAFRSHPVAYGPCDSYFVETSRYDWYQQRAQERERARQRAKEHQHVIAGELSRITADEYAEDMLEHMEAMEPRTLPDVNSIDLQTEIQWFMRPYLLDFLVEAHAAFSLLPETLYLAINLLDRYCSKRVVYKRHYQLVGCAALLIAAKYGDKKDRVPQIKELKAMCCSLYEEEMFTQMEWHLLQTLDWLVGHPTVDNFLQIALCETSYDAELEHMTWYISELALFHKEFVSVLPSTLARSSLALARCILSKPSTGPAGWADIYDQSIVAQLYEQLKHPSSVVSKKYASFQLSAVSLSVQVFIERQCQLERQRAMAPTPIVEIVYVEDKMDVVSGNPRTPQKMPIAAMMSHGLYTPPITPESEAAHVVYNKHNTSHPQPPPTPSPPSGTQHPMVYAQHNSMMMHQPHPWAP